MDEQQARQVLEYAAVITVRPFDEPFASFVWGVFSGKDAKVRAERFVAAHPNEYENCRIEITTAQLL